MILLAILIVLVVLGFVLSSRIRQSSPAGGSTPNLSKRVRSGARSSGESPRTWIDLVLDRWLAAGLLSREQVDSIRTYEAARVPAPTRREVHRRFSPIVEGLGYLGGVLGIVGVMMLVVHYWPDMNVAFRLLLTLGATAVFLVAGALVDEGADPAFTRLRWFLWVLGTASFGTAGFVLADGVFEFEEANRSLLSVSLAVTLVGGLLWGRRVRPLQEIALFGGAIVSVAGAVEEFAGTGWVGSSVGLAGFAVAWLGWRNLTPVPPLTTAIGLLATIPAAGIAADDWRGPAFLVAAIVHLTLVIVGAWPDVITDKATALVTSIVGGVGLVQWAGATIGHFSGEAGILTGFVVAAVGLMFVVLGDRELVGAPLIFQAVGGLALLGGVAITATQSQTVATSAGLVVAVGSLVVGSTPGRVTASMLGLVALLIYVPWSIGWFFPGEGRAPLLIAVSGLLIVGVAIVLARMGDRFRRELGGPHGSALGY